MAQNTTPLSASGQKDIAITRPPNILESMRGLISEVGGVTWTPGERETPMGAIMARQSTTERYQERKSTELAVAGANMDTTITVDNARPFRAGEAVTVVGESADVIASVDYDLNTITLTTGLTATRAIDVRVFRADLTLGTAVGILMETVPGTNSVRGSIPDATAVMQVDMAHEGMFKLLALVAEGLDVQARADLNADNIGANTVRVRGVGSAT